jgi:hypothetical protein
MRTAWVAVVIGVVACKKEPVGDTPRPKAPDDTTVAEADALWKLAPKTAVIGAIVTGRALGLADRAVAFVHRVAGTIPDAEGAVTTIDQLRRMLLGGAASYADAGLDLDRGLAFFGDGTNEGTVMVLPVSDRDRFVATHGTRDGDVDKIGRATCKPIGAHYACSRDPASLVLGGGDLGKHAGVSGVRGEAEMVVDLTSPKLPLPPSVPFKPTGPATLVIGLARGELVIRGHLPATFSDPVAAFTRAKPASFDVTRASGFAILPLDVVASLVPDAQLIPGVSIRELLASVAGPLQITIPAGVADAELRVPLGDPGPATKLLAGCGMLGALVPATAGPGSCSVGPIPPFGISAAIWLDGNTLRGAREQGVIPKGTDAAPPSAAGRELAGYTVAYWGRGSLIGIDVPGVPPQIAPLMRAFGYLSELGMGGRVTPDGASILLVARTIHDNPPEVAAKLEAMIAKGAPWTEVEALAAASPGTPLAADVSAGRIGLMAPNAVIGVLAAVAIPAFIEYMQRGKPRDAEVESTESGTD